MKSIVLTASLVVALFAWNVQPANANPASGSLPPESQGAIPILFDTGAPNILDPDFNWRASDAGIGSYAADNFLLAAASNVTGVQWYGSYLIPGPLPTDSFTIRFYAAGGPVPAAGPFATASLAGPVTRISTGQFPLGSELFFYSVEIAPLGLAGGTAYWMSIANSTGSLWAWAYAPTGSTHASGGSPSGPWSEFGARNLGFRLFGNEVPVAAESKSWGGLKALYH